jgi:hypothetical protein
VVGAIIALGLLDLASEAGVNVVVPNWTTRNRSEYTTPMNVTIPIPTGTGASITRPVETVNPIDISGTASPSPTVASRETSWTAVARTPRRAPQLAPEPLAPERTRRT